MKVLRLVAAALLGSLLLAGCAKNPSQNVYNYDEVGKSSAVNFGTVVASRPIDIVGKNTGAGALVGAAAGGGAGAYVGSGSGTAWAVGAGVLAGAIVGAMTEQALADRKGIEYTVTLETGVTLTVAQDYGEGEPVFEPGDRVMVQNSGGYQRVLPASHLPTEIARPQGIKVVD